MSGRPDRAAGAGTVIPRAPLFVIDRSGDVLSFRRLRDLESDLEPADVESGEIAFVFDAEGREVRIAVESARPGFFGGPGSVRVVDIDPYPRHSRQLARHLAHYLTLVGRPASARAYLSDLVRSFLEWRRS